MGQIRRHPNHHPGYRRCFMVIQYMRQLDTSNPPACRVEIGTILEALRASADRLGMPIALQLHHPETGTMDAETIRAWLERRGHEVERLEAAEG
jgi:hypothetical protein